ncbi:hypothetical protein AB0A74_05230 [Saccharothrix sp. NPDC042600]|uniref:hypothetical protein n=1 Tax=Saccharothrix TaxID=2071 RepID=UPI0033FF28C0|nr:hypothetical protein GCM10017745_37010 [Saccharothrix mutabilis subsp. capreolus]
MVASGGFRTRRPTATGPGGGAWQRTVLAVFGDPDTPGHAVGRHVVTTDFGGDGNDEFLVAPRGPVPWQGVLYHKAKDPRMMLFRNEFGKPLCPPTPRAVNG